MKIPTKLKGPITSMVINKRRLKIFPTDVGDMTGKEVEEVTGVKVWKILQRYYQYGFTCAGLFSDEKIVPEKIEKPVREFSQEEIDACMKISKKIRHLRLKKLQALGTWEAKQQCRR